MQFQVTFFTVLDAVLWCMVTQPHAVPLVALPRSVVLNVVINGLQAVQEALMAAEWPEELLTMPAAAKEFRSDDHGKKVVTNRRICR